MHFLFFSFKLQILKDSGYCFTMHQILFFFHLIDWFCDPIRGKIWVILPIPLVRPSLNNNRIPTWRYSGWLTNLNNTEAVSFVCSPLSFESIIPSITQVCLTLPMCTVVWNPENIAVAWYTINTVAWNTIEYLYL